MEASAKYQWLKDRQKGIGGSDVAAVLGLSPYKTPLEVFNEKVADEPIEIEENAPMRWGLLLEDAIAQAYQEDTGNKVVKVNRILKHKEYDFLLANIDRRITSLGKDGPGILEIKTASSWAVKKWETEIPLQYYFQVQHYMSVTGYTWGVMALLVDGRDFNLYPVERDDDVIADMNKRLESFWYDNVLKRVAPDPLTEDDLNSLYPQSMAGKFINSNQIIQEIHEELKQVKQKSKRLKDREAELAMKVKQAMGDSEAVLSAGNPIFTWKTSVSNRLDQKALKADHPELFEEYKRPSESRRFLVK